MRTSDALLSNTPHVCNFVHEGTICERRFETSSTTRAHAQWLDHVLRDHQPEPPPDPECDDECPALALEE